MQILILRSGMGLEIVHFWGNLFKIPKPRLHPRPIQSQPLKGDPRHRRVLKLPQVIPMCSHVWEPLFSTELVFTKNPPHSLLVKN